MQLSERVSSIKPSATLSVTTKASELKAQGKDIISLGAGEPDFDTPDFIKNAAKLALDNNETRYTAVGGTNKVKEAICNKLSRENNLNYSPENILVSSGAKHSIYNLLQAVLNPDDEVIIPAPYWVSYPDMCILAGAKPVIIRADISQNFKITPEQIAASITPKTKIIFLNSPSNPTGVCYNKEELSKIAKVILPHPDILVMTDDIYEHILWHKDGFCNIAMACKELFDRTVVINGVSKSYAMTGWRIGYAASPSVKLIKAMCKIQGQSTSNPCSISQAATIAALEGDQSFIKDNNQIFQQRHDYVVSALNEVDGIKCNPSDGAFYSFFDVQDLIKMVPELDTDVELAEKLITDCGVALVPGSAFGLPGYMRLSYATSLDILKEAISRLKNFQKKYA